MIPTEREVAEAIGDLCDGRALEESAADWIARVRRGPIETRDEGLRLYYVSTDTMALDNVDTNEGIWSTPADGLHRNADGSLLFDLADDSAVYAFDLVPLTALDDPARFARLEARWAGDKRDEWAAFVRRVVVPLRAHG